MALLLDLLLSKQDRMLYKQHADFSVRNFSLFIGLNLIIYCVLTVIVADAMRVRVHVLFGAVMLVMQIVSLCLANFVGADMQKSPTKSIFWVVFFGVPLVAWWLCYCYVLIQAGNLYYLQQYTTMANVAIFLGIALTGRFSRAFVGFIVVILAVVLPQFLRLPFDPNKTLATQLLLATCAELVFLGTLNGYIVAIFKAKSENIKLLDALQLKNVALEQSNISQSRYLSAASHDLRQPLHALALLTNDVQRKNDRPEIAVSLKKMELAIDSLSQSFNAMLNLSRLDAGGIKPKLKTFPIDAMFHRVIAEFSDVAQERGLTLKVRPSKFWVHSDQDMLYSILSNFVSNALRYTDTGGVLVGCRLADESMVSISVYDTGLGVPPDKAKQIFQEYQRLEEATQRAKGGVGLGLAIAERTARLLNAKLSVKSSVGRGSAFGIMIRRAEATQSKEAALISPQDELKGKRVALLDDDPDVLESLGGLLQSWGMDVSFVLSAEMLQELAEEEGGFDFVVSDYHLGLESENGLDVIRAAIQAAPLKPPYCILLTGDTRTELAQEAVQAGAYLWHKPIRPTRLRAHLNGVVQQQNPL